MTEMIPLHEIEARRRKGNSAADKDRPLSKPDLSVLADHTIDAPALPLDAFSEQWREWLTIYAESKTIPLDYALGALLPVAAAMIGNARRAFCKPDWIEPPILWMANIGKPSAGKSPAQDGVVKVLGDMEADMAFDFDATLRQWETDKTRAELECKKWQSSVQDSVENSAPAPVKPESAVVPDPPARPRLYTGDPTTQALAMLLAGNPKGLLLVRDELAGFFGDFDRYSGNGGDRHLWLEVFGARPHTVDRKSHEKPIKIAHMSVSILGGLVPDSLAKVIQGSDDGLAARILFVWPEPIRELNRAAKAADMTWLRNALDRLRCLPMGQDETGKRVPVAIPLSASAEDLFFKWREVHRQRDDVGPFAGFINKLPGYVLRLTLVAELMNWAIGDEAEPQELSAETLAAVCDFTDSYLIPMAERAHGDASRPRAELHASMLAKYIVRERLETINTREISKDKNLPSLVKAEDINPAIAVLEDASWLLRIERHGAGRQRNDYWVNSQLWNELDG